MIPASASQVLRRVGASINPGGALESVGEGVDAIVAEAWLMLAPLC